MWFVVALMVLCWVLLICVVEFWVLVLICFCSVLRLMGLIFRVVGGFIVVVGWLLWLFTFLVLGLRVVSGFCVLFIVTFGDCNLWFCGIIV